MSRPPPPDDPEPVDDPLASPRNEGTQEGHPVARPRHDALTLDDRVALLRGDATSGAAEIARAAADLIREAAEDAQAATATELASTLSALALRIVDAQPAMAPLVTLAREVLGAVEGAASAGAPLAEVRRRASQAAAAFGAGLPERAAAVAATAARHLPARGSILTLSRSSTVERTLLEVARSRPLRVVCLESRPLCEGRALAEALARAGVDVTLAVDAALDSLIPGTAALLLGADSIGDRGVVNKIGSAAAVHAAARHRVPVMVAADSTKLLPPGFRQPLADARPAAEVLSAPSGDDLPHGPRRSPPGIRVWNHYFERVPARLVTLFATEARALGAAELEAHRTGMFVPLALRDRAEGRR